MSPKHESYLSMVISNSLLPRKMAQRDLMPDPDTQVIILWVPSTSSQHTYLTLSENPSHENINEQLK